MYKKLSFLIKIFVAMYMLMWKGGISLFSNPRQITTSKGTMSMREIVFPGEEAPNG